MNAAPSGHLVYLNLSFISVLQSLSYLSMEVGVVKNWVLRFVSFQYNVLCAWRLSSPVREFTPPELHTFYFLPFARIVDWKYFKKVPPYSDLQEVGLTKIICSSDEHSSRYHYHDAHQPFVAA